MSHIESLALVERGERLEIANKAEYEAAAEYLKGATALMRRIEEHYGPLKQAAHKLHGDLNKAEKSQTAPIMLVIERVKGLMLGWQRAQERLAAKQQEALQKKAAKHGTAVQVQVEADIPKQEGVSNRSTWRCVVDNPELVPSMFMIPDQQALNEVARRMKDKFNIPGCHVEEDVNVIVKGV